MGSMMLTEGIIMLGSTLTMGGIVRVMTIMGE